jgi:transposase
MTNATKIITVIEGHYLNLDKVRKFGYALGMTEMLTITSERVDDIPLLLAHMRRMDLPRLLESYFLIHGNRQGLGFGWTTTIWLAHILSQADHRMNQVQPWVERQLETLRIGTGKSVQALDVTDDRLADVLRTLSDDTCWINFERRLTGTLLRVYDLQLTRVRLDSTTASGYWEVSEDGLFQFGHSKDHRPDLPQVKVMLATLDPLGLPIATDVLSGECADDPLYLPAIARVRASVGRRGLLYVGDCKMSAFDTRAGVQAGSDFYLCPLSAVQVPATLLAQYLSEAWASGPALVVEREKADGTLEPIADAYERSATLTAVVNTWPQRWVERHVLVRSHAQARRAEETLRSRLAQAQAALDELLVRRRGKACPKNQAGTQLLVDTILARFQVADLLQVTVAEQLTLKRVRAYRDRPAGVREQRTLTISHTVDPLALASALAHLGWRVYATNMPLEQLPVAQVVLAYREEYLVERSLGRLKGQPLSLSPMYVERDDHATGLIRLLAIALRVLTLLEFVVRRRLAQDGEVLTGLHAGNPKRATARPTTERLLEAFRGITLTILVEPDRIRRHLTTLSPLQQRILALLDFSPTIYTDLGGDSAQPP